MIKIFLVEDEFVVREGIKNNIPWRDLGFDFCGEAGDGELAYPKIRELQPDIVITDIRMPFMDGLDLSRLLKKEMPQVEIMILSGFEEFEYAKEAIRLGIAEYLTKPVSSEELIKAVQRLAEKVNEKKQEGELIAKYEREMEENLLAERRKLFGNLVTGQTPVHELINMAAGMKLELSAQWYQIVLLSINSTTHAPEEYSGRLVEIDKNWKALDEAEETIVFDRNFEGKALLFTADSESELVKKRESYLNGFVKMLESQKHIRYYGACGIRVQRLSEVKESFESANIVFLRRYMTDDSTILSEADASKTFDNSADEEFDIRSVNPKMIDRAKIKNFMKIGEVEEISIFVDAYFRDLGRSAVESTLFRQYLAMDVYFAASECATEMKLTDLNLPVPDAASGVINTVEDAKKYVNEIMKAVINARNSASGVRFNDIIGDVVKYIEENYADDELSLNSIAAHVNFSPSYLSMVFSQETGDTLIHYLTEYRMNKAKELLKCTCKKSSIIAAEVGYKNPHYFSYLFRKTQGVTPTAFRGNGGEEE